MCGIVGWVSKNASLKLTNWADDALLMDSVRGDHSTGVMFSDADTSVFKKAIAGYDFIQLKQYKKVRESRGFFIGHNRYATMGSHCDDNAHPFETEDWVGVHNGSLTHGWKSYLPSGFDVDSEAIIHNIQDEGIKTTVEMLDGAYSLVLFNKQEDKLYFARNDERPMFLATTKDKKVFFGSDQHIIRCACDRHGYALEKILSIGVGTICSVNLDGELVEEDKFKVKKKTYQNNYGNYSRGSYYSSQVKHLPHKKKELGIKDIVNAFFFKQYEESDGSYTVSGLIDDDDMESVIITNIDPALSKLLLESEEPVRCKIVDTKFGVHHCEVDDTSILHSVDISDEQSCSICGKYPLSEKETKGHSQGVVCDGCCVEYGWA